jgi:hypothetical protein
MSDVDRLSNSGLYPALPIAADQRSRKDGSAGQPGPERRPAAPPPAGPAPDQDPPRQPKSLIDEYA